VLDERTPHLGLSITPKGTKTFFIQRRVGGRPVRMMLGRFPEVTVDQARRKAASLNMEIAAGNDPYERSRTARSSATFKEFFHHEYMEKHAKAHKKSWRQDADLFRLHLGPIADIRLAAMEKRDIQALHVNLGRNVGRRTANLAVTLIHSVFAKAGEWSAFEGQNPASGIRRFKETSRDRFLRPDEVPRFFDALNAETAESGTTLWRDFFLLALFTGARRANVLAMRWKDIDLDGAVWTIPAESTKSGRTYNLPLAAAAVDILRSRAMKTDRHPDWVFPARRGTGHLADPKSAWARIRKRSGLEDFRIHDLRRTLGSWQAAAGTSLPIIGRSLGHVAPAATQIYARLELDPVRDSVDKASRGLLEAADRRKGGE